MKIGYLGIDQFGAKYQLHKHPRKELMQELCCTHISKMYEDNEKGEAVHTGYIIRGLWISIYEIHGWKGVGQ